jgi:hypothetical protein
MCKMTMSPDEEPTAGCDGCDRKFPESELTDCEARYVDETTETFQFCRDCLKVEEAYDNYYPEAY